MRLLTGILVAGLLLAAPVWAQDEAAPTAAQSAPADDDGKVVCRKERVVGSMIPKRTCTTKAELRKIQESSRSGLEELQHSGSTVSASGG
ncbi:MAG: hypothetical protein HC809_04185 [Gammaproteobacteria bacterium]|nr:hypothetical protein [Gammaproteobacteria bacterium]